MLAESTKESGMLTRDMDTALSSSRTETDFKEITNSEKPTARAVTLGRMERLMKENGKQARSVATESGEAFKETPTSASGRTTK